MALRSLVWWLNLVSQAWQAIILDIVIHTRVSPVLFDPEPGVMVGVVFPSQGVGVVMEGQLEVQVKLAVLLELLEQNGVLVQLHLQLVFLLLTEV